MAYINRENLIQVLAHENSNTEIGRQYYGAIYQKVMNFPTADVVEVVRCKDCRYRDEMCMCSHPKQEGILPLTYPLDFCSYGERKEENHV